MPCGPRAGPANSVVPSTTVAIRDAGRLLLIHKIDNDRPDVGRGVHRRHERIGGTDAMYGDDTGAGASGRL